MEILHGKFEAGDCLGEKREVIVAPVPGGRKDHLDVRVAQECPQLSRCRKGAEWN